MAISEPSLAFNHDANKQKSDPDHKGSGTEKAAGCAPANYRKTLSFNDVSCQIETGGLLFLDRANGLATYKVPKTGNVTTIYAGALWMGGVDPAGNLKLAAVKYRNNGNDFWPGPLSAFSGTGNYNPYEPQGSNATRDFGEANIDPDQCLLYDNIFTVTKAGVTQFVKFWDCQDDPEMEGCEGVTLPSNDVLAQIAAWPGNGDPTRGQDRFLAPFYDRDQDGDYEPEEGDYPWYDDILNHNDVECKNDRRVTLFGDETHWWVFNDKGNSHTESGGYPIGMEIRAQAFAFATDDEINKMTFYNYELINKGTMTLNKTYFSQYVDMDLGNYSDDYAGCDVERGLGYMYNADAYDDPQDGRPGYEENPPAIGIDFFEGPYQDPDGTDNPGPVLDTTTGEWIAPSVFAALAQNGIVYKGLGIGYQDGIIDNERYGMRNFTTYTGQPAPYGQSDPETASQYYNYMKGKWQFGEDLLYGGTGYPGSSGSQVLTNYMFPADSDPLKWATGGNDPGEDVWSEFEPLGPGTTSNPKGDRRFVQSAGPFTLKPGAINNITVGIVYGRSYEGEIFSSVNALKVADTKAQALFDNCFRIMSPPDAPVVTIQELGNELIIMLDNPVGSNNYADTYEREDDIRIQNPPGIVYDRYFRFEGYQIFQLKNELATVSDLDDASKARLIAQCDKKNGITKLINFEYDEELDLSIPVKKVDGEDKGIRHSFRVTEDLFATGDRRLVNHKKYYYMAVAYAYNNYKKYDPNDPELLDGQKLPYLRSRLNVDGTPLSATEAVPHFVSPEQGGTVQNAVYGQTPRIKRLDGKGNGNLALELTRASEEQIVLNGFLDEPVYDYNGGPINVKVIDPLNVVGGYFECKFDDYNTNKIDSAHWTIVHYDSENGFPIDSVSSEGVIIQGTEQLIPQWGVSVQIAQVPTYFPGNGGANTGKFTDPISSSIEFADSTKPWLSFVQDDPSLTPLNWIRSGSYVPNQETECDTWTGPNFLNPCNYKDEKGKDPKELYSKLLGGGVGPHKLVGYQGAYMPLAVPESYVAYTSARINASISYLPSVDIVITSDSTKWTRCVVIELGRDANLNQGGAEPGELRASLSVGKDGFPDGSGTSGMGWFPGYAIDLETGARLHMAFGENSFLGGDNGNDMVWNPTSTIMDQNGTYVLGGQQPIWIYGVNINNEGCPYYDGVNNWVYDQYLLGTSNSYKKVFTSLMWIANTVVTPGYDVRETDVRIILRVNRPYEEFTATGKNGGKPMYSWNMDVLQTTTASQDALTSALDLINVVPNPYYAFSDYERNRLDTRVKITNLPDNCTVTIYNVSGKMIRQFKKDNPITSLDWDLKNSVGVPIASGVYIIHVDVPGVGERILKFYGGMRQIDLENI